MALAVTVSPQRDPGESDPALTPTVDGTPERTGSRKFETRRGETIARFVVLEKIGAGGMGVVYAAFDPQLDRKLAVKVLRDEDQNPVRRERLHREAQAMARLSHPNVCIVHDVGTWQGQIYVAMEFVEGQTLGRWLATEQPDWRTIVETFIQAGRGLEAAHAAGLIHRDFKPDNVVVGVDRVRVMDFGLARQSERDDASSASTSGSGTSLSPLEVLAQSVSSGDRLGSPLTREGAMTGTPAYMSPEQHFGTKATPAADQFSFCVSLYQALYGVRPFPGNSVLEIATSIVDRNVTEPPKGTAVPGELRDIVLRGLEPQVEDRWPSMTELLAQLEHSIAPRRASSLPWLGTGALAIALLVGFAALGDGDPCREVAVGLDAVWSPPRGQAARDAFVRSELPYAPDAWDRVAAQLDRYADGWTGARRDACEATHVQRTQSADLMDLRMSCLDRRLAELDTVVDVLVSGSPDVVERADDIVGGLRSVRSCADTEALLARVPPPEDETTWARVEELRIDLRRAALLGTAGRFDEALRVARQAQTAAASIDYPPLHAEADLAVGLAEENAADYRGALKHLERAQNTALAAGHDDVAAEAATDLVRVAGARLSRHDDGLRWSRQARALNDRAGGGRNREINLLAAEAGVHDDAARHERARQMRQKALDLLQERTDPDPLRVARSEMALANTYQAMGRYEEAQSLLQSALRDAEVVLGRDHPQLRTFLNPLGVVLDDLGRYEEAVAVYQRARTICDASLPENHPGGASVRINLGVTLYHLERFDDAQKVQQEALRMLVESTGPETVKVAAALNNLATLHVERRQFDEASEYLKRAVGIWTKIYGSDHPRVAEGLVNLGGVAFGLQQDAQAQLHLHRAIEIYESSLGSRHPALIKPLFQLAVIAHRAERNEEFLEYTTRAVELSARAEPHDAASVYYRHADALWSKQQRHEAYMFALAARTIWEASGDLHRERVADVDEWMDHDWEVLRSTPAPGAPD